MIRPVTCLCMALSGVAGLYLYQVKQRAHVLDRQIEHTVQEAREARERTRMLNAEWTLLNEPGRLQELAERYLHLEPMKPDQFVQLSALGAHLPAIEPVSHDASDQIVEATDQDDGDQAPASTPVANAPDDAAAAGVLTQADLPDPPVVHVAPRRLPSQPAPHLMMATASVTQHHDATHHQAARHDTMARDLVAQDATPHDTAAAALPIDSALTMVRHETRDSHRGVVATRTVLLPKTTIYAKPLPLAVPRRPARSMLNTMNAPTPYPTPSYVMHATMVHTAPMTVRAPQPIQTVSVRTAPLRTAAIIQPHYGSALGMAGGDLPPPVPVATMR